MAVYQAQGNSGYGYDSRTHYAMSNIQTPQYEKQRSQEQIQVSMPATSPYGQDVHPRWSWCSVGWSMFAYLCCSPFICSFFGMMCALMSYSDHKGGDYDRSAYKRRCAWGCSMTAIVLGVLFIVSIVVLAVVWPAYLIAYYSAALSQIQQSTSNSG